MRNSTCSSFCTCFTPPVNCFCLSCDLAVGADDRRDRDPAGLVLFEHESVHLLQIVPPGRQLGFGLVGARCGELDDRAVTEGNARLAVFERVEHLAESEARRRGVVIERGLVMRGAQAGEIRQALLLADFERVVDHPAEHCVGADLFDDGHDHGVSGSALQEGEKSLRRSDERAVEGQVMDGAAEASLAEGEVVAQRADVVAVFQ